VRRVSNPERPEHYWYLALITMVEKKLVIDRFTTEAGYGFLSNFHPSTIYMDGKSYKTVEHAYQAYKTIDESNRELIRNAPSPDIAKRLGYALVLRPDWEQVKIPLMKEFLKKKFENPFLRPLLLQTGDAELIYTNTWNDQCWGVCRGRGENWLGKLLMELREELKKSGPED
jgi:ribA/ribD-fused uncharacterized protein